MATGCIRADSEQPTVDSAIAESIQAQTQTHTLTQTLTLINTPLNDAEGIAIATEPEFTQTPVVWMATEEEPPSVGTYTPAATFTPTKKPTRTNHPTQGPSPRWTRSPTPTATATKTPQPPDAVLRISRPGLYSRITSPYKIQAMVTKGEDGYVYLSLIGEDQRVIFADALDSRRSIYSRFIIVPRLEFSIPSVAETARVSLYTLDLLGRITALSTVDVILLSIGDNDTNLAQRLYESFVITNPKRGGVIQGGRLIISGKVAPFNENPIIVEIIGENGETLSLRELKIPMPEGGQTYIPFVVEMTYAVPAETAALITIRQESDNRLPGTIALSSVAVTLYP